MKKNIVFLLFLFAIGAQGQSPGYQGRRLCVSLGGSLSLFSRVYSPRITDSLKIYSDELSGSRFFPEMRISYATGSALETGISFHQINSLFLLDRIYGINTGVAELYLKRFEKARGGLAPLGTWVQGGIALIRNQYHEKPELEQKKVFFSGALTFGIGMQRAIGNRWLVDGGWELMVPPQLFMSDMKLAPGYYQGIHDYYKNLSYASLSAVRVRFGFLLY